MKNVTANHASHGPGAAWKKAPAAGNGAAKRRVKRPDFLANLERLGYSEKVGARMLTKFHNSLS